MLTVGSGSGIFVVDAHVIVAESVAMALRSSGLDRVSVLRPDQIARGPAAAAGKPAPGDIVLLSLLTGGGRTTLPLIRPLADRGCRVVVMTGAQGLPLAGECLRRGAETVLDSEMSFAQLLRAVRHLDSGEPALTPDERSALEEALVGHQEASDALLEPFGRLTPREADVLAALIAGRAPKQIAAHQRIAISTVRTHIRGVLAKLDVSTEREALAMARNAGWPESADALPPADSLSEDGYCPGATQEGAPAT